MITIITLAAIVFLIMTIDVWLPLVVLLLALTVGLALVTVIIISIHSIFTSPQYHEIAFIVLCMVIATSTFRLVRT